MLLERATGKKLGMLFDEWIARPTGMEDFLPADVTETLEPGTSRWPALTVRMSTRDLARFGQLWLDRGKWKDQQIIPSSWIDRALPSRSPTRAVAVRATEWARKPWNQRASLDSFL
jgi:CubicO group peptidase (beta-lactamase class C family)